MADWNVPISDLPSDSPDLMPNAYPPRKMFSTHKVSQKQYTDDNRGTSMANIKALAKAAKVGPGLRKVVPKEVKLPQ